MVHSGENTINVQFVMVPLVKVRKHLHVQEEVGEVRRPENKKYWLAPSKFFQRKKGRCANLSSVQLNGGIRYCN